MPKIDNWNIMEKGDVPLELLAFVGENDTKNCCLCCKALAKRTRKSTQVNTSLQNQNLRTDLRRVAKRLASSRKSQEAVNLTPIYSWLAINFCRLALCGQTVKTYLRPLVYEFELDQSQRKSSQVENLHRLVSPCGQCLMQEGDLKYIFLARNNHYLLWPLW